jgi:transcriptional regulator with XRE-family HTH domain
MPRPANYSDSSEAAVRAHFGLTLQQLARYLGVSVGFVAHLEAGRRPLPAALADRLIHLGRLLPPPLGQGPPAPPDAPAPDLFGTLAPPAAPASPEPLDPEPLRRRLRDCRLKVLVLGQQLDGLHARAAALARRRRGLAQLMAATPPAAPAEAAHYAHWLAELAEDLALADPRPAATATQRLLLAVRVGALQAEAEALARHTPAE